jgi:hypothetical protein
MVWAGMRRGSATALKASEVVLARAMTKHYMPIWEYVKMTQSVRTADRSWRRRIRVASGRVCDRDAGHTLRALQESTAIRRMKRRRSDGYFLRYRHRANVSTNRC